jgi:NAD+ kinase
MTGPFRKVGLWGRLAEPSVAEPAMQIVSHLRRRGIEVYAALPAEAESLYPDVVRVPESELPRRVDLLVAVGGDGTMLHAARSAAREAVPLLGINRGRLGFLADVSPELMPDTIDGVLRGDFQAEDRLMLEAELVSGDHRGNPMLALNDVAVQKAGTGRMLDCVAWVDGSYVNTHGGDGLIVATPTGSTAYALSCGGPIIQPNVDALVMAPICPHTLSDRPLVLKSDSVIELRVQTSIDNPANVTCDGHLLGELGIGDTLRISRARHRVTLLHPSGYDYHELLRTKLGWGRANRAQRG